MVNLWGSLIMKKRRGTAWVAYLSFRVSSVGWRIYRYSAGADPGGGGGVQGVRMNPLNFSDHGAVFF